MTDVTWMTQEAFDRLQAELADREGPRRTEITQRIAAAREEGDLKENGGYHAAKEEQGKNEARIRVLKHTLENSRIGVPEAADGEVVQGMVVTVRFPDLDDEETFLLGSREEAGLTDVEVYSATSPLGTAVLGHKVGDETSYETPNGKSIRVVITNVRPNN
jgi:transcription elongation factor GreA